MPAPVQIPADIDREDRILGDLTARQVAILGAAAVLAYLTWSLTGPTRLLWCAAALLPLTVIAVALAFGSRDGLSLDRVLWAALVQRAQTPTQAGPRPIDHTSPDDDPDADPDDVRGHSRGSRSRRPARIGRAVLARVPVRGVRTLSPYLGVVDLGARGMAVVCAVTPIHLAMRTESEQADALAGFARWLHALSAPVQIVTRTRPLELGPVLDDLHRRAVGLPHPALAAAARAHAEHLAGLAATTELTTHEHLLVFRAATVASVDERGGLRRAARTAVETLCRRADEAAALLGPLGLRVTVLDAPAAATVVRAATRPADPHAEPDTEPDTDADADADGYDDGQDDGLSALGRGPARPIGPLPRRPGPSRRTPPGPPMRAPWFDETPTVPMWPVPLHIGPDDDPLVTSGTPTTSPPPTPGDGPRADDDAQDADQQIPDGWDGDAWKDDEQIEDANFQPGRIREALDDPAWRTR